MDISLTSIKKIAINILQRYHIIIFVVVIIGGLAVVVFLLNGVIVQSSEGGDYTSTTNNATFDQSTIDRIKKLKVSGDTSSQIDFSKGRTNPFVE